MPLRSEKARKYGETLSKVNERKIFRGLLGSWEDKKMCSVGQTMIFSDRGEQVSCPQQGTESNWFKATVGGDPAC